MKPYLSLLFLIAFINTNAQEALKYTKEKEELLVQKIREKYKHINKQKRTYKLIESYNNHEPEGIDPDSEYENNEDGHEEITTAIYTDNGELRLETCTKHLYKYQFPYTRTSFSETYYWNGEIIFIYEGVTESLGKTPYAEMASEITDLKENRTKAIECRYYFNNDDCFRALYKKVECNGEKDLDSLLNHTLNSKLDSNINIDPIDACNPDFY